VRTVGVKLGVLSDDLFTWSASLAKVIRSTQLWSTRVSVRRLRREVEALAGLLEIVLLDPDALRRLVWALVMQAMSFGSCRDLQRDSPD
jgi:CHAD domain-containing protein